MDGKFSRPLQFYNVNARTTPEGVICYSVVQVNGSTYNSFEGQTHKPEEFLAMVDGLGDGTRVRDLDGKVMDCVRALN